MDDILYITVKNSRWTSSSDLFTIVFKNKKIKNKKYYRTNLPKEIKEFFEKCIYVATENDGTIKYMTMQDAYMAGVGDVKRITYYKKPSGDIIARSYPSSDGIVLDIGKRFDVIDPITRLNKFFISSHSLFKDEARLKKEVSNLIKYHGNLG